MPNWYNILVLVPNNLILVRNEDLKHAGDETYRSTKWHSNTNRKKIRNKTGTCPSANRMVLSAKRRKKIRDFIKHVQQTNYMQM
jgi:hypothetical protein